MRMSVHIQPPCSSRLMMRSAGTRAYTRAPPARAILTVSITGFDLVGWYKWVLWSYVRLLHKPQRAEMESESWIGREGVCCTITKGIRTAPNPPPTTHACAPHTTTTYRLSLATCVFLETMGPPLWSTFGIHTHTHTQVPHPHASAVHQPPVFVIIFAVCHCLPSVFPH